MRTTRTDLGPNGSISSLLAAALLCLAATMPTAYAAEGGLSNFPYGAQATYSAFLPPPGATTFFGYSLYLKADKVRDNDGDRIPGVEVEAIVLAPRFVHSWKTTLAGFKLSSGVLFEPIYVKVKVPGAEDEDTGIFEFGIEPLYLSRSFGNWHTMAGPIFYFRSGPYNRNALANTTSNYNSIAIQANLTWTPSPRWDVSLNSAIEFKDENEDTDYRSGTQAGLTFGMGHRPFANQAWDLGISGFYTRQLADDEIDGEDVPGGGRTRKFAIGPKLVYWFSPAVAVVAQYHREMEVRNATDGDLFWLECAFPI